MEYILSFFILSMTACVWFLLCNDRTYSQRKVMGELVFLNNRDRIIRSKFDDRHDYPNDFFSYSGHLMCLFIFKDPRKEYLKRGWKLGFGF